MSRRGIAQNVGQIVFISQKGQRTYHGKAQDLSNGGRGRGNLRESHNRKSRLSEKPHSSAKDAVIGEDQGCEASSTTWISSFCTRSRANSRHARMSSLVKSG